MRLWLLTNIFNYSDPDELPDRVGIFDSFEAMEKAKVEYMKLMPTLPRDMFNFVAEEFELNKVYQLLA